MLGCKAVTGRSRLMNSDVRPLKGVEWLTIDVVEGDYYSRPRRWISQIGRGLGEMMRARGRAHRLFCLYVLRSVHADIPPCGKLAYE